MGGPERSARVKKMQRCCTAGIPAQASSRVLRGAVRASSTRSRRKSARCDPARRMRCTCAPFRRRPQQIRTGGSLGGSVACVALPGAYRALSWRSARERAGGSSLGCRWVGSPRERCARGAEAHCDRSSGRRFPVTPVVASAALCCAVAMSESHSTREVRLALSAARTFCGIRSDRYEVGQELRTAGLFGTWEV